MTHHCIKYRLAADGTVPPFLCLHPDGVGGMFMVGDSTTPSPRDMVMIGLSETDETGDAEVLPTKEDLENYLAAVGVNWTVQNPNFPNDIEKRIPFDPVKAADWVWNRKLALDANG